MKKPQTNPKFTKRENRDAEITDSAAKDYREDKSQTRKPSNRRKNGNGKKHKDVNNTSKDNAKYNVSTSNPFQWYNAFPQVIKDAGNLSFGVPIGKKIPMRFRINTSSPLAYDSNYVSPGIMVLRFVPGIGWSEDKTSPINRSATKMFVYLRTGQKAAKDYDSQDMMMMIMALDSCYAYHKLMQRIYGCMSLATPTNFYYPRALVQAQGVDYADLEANMSDFRSYINQFAISLGSYTLPGNIDIIKRHMWMCSGLYADQNSAKAQTYMFVPSGFWRYDNTVAQGSALVWEKWADPKGDYATRKTFADIKAFGQKLLNAILGDEDAAFISGDLLAAFGQSAMAQVDETPDGYRILPSYDPIVLSQIQNATITGALESSSLKITQDPTVNNGAIIFKPTVVQKTPALTGSVPLNIVSFVQSSEQIVEATRLTAASSTAWTKTVENLVADQNQSVNLDACSADIVENLYIATNALSTGAGWHKVSTQDIRWMIATSGGILGEQLRSAGYLSSFDWAPRLNLWTQDSASTMSLSGMIWETDNVTLATWEQLEELHTAAFTSLFNVPEMAFTLKK